MRAAEAASTRLHAMPNNAAAAMATFRRQRGYGAFEAIENMRAVTHRYREGAIVVIATAFASCHGRVLQVSYP